MRSGGFFFARKLSRKGTASRESSCLESTDPISASEVSHYPLLSSPPDLRTRISYFVLLATTTSAALLKRAARRLSKPRASTGNAGAGA
jgi:hypothetical protein